jgi:hypothetical protein
MKKLIILFSFLFAFASMNAQSIWRPLDKSVFKTKITTDKTVSVSQTPSLWLWRISANVIATELVYNKVSKQFDSAPLSGVGPGIGYKHMTLLADGSIYNDFGVNFVALVGTDLSHITPASIKPALTINAFNFVNVGIDLINFKTVGILIGASVTF